MALGWNGEMNSLRNYLISRGLWNAGETKPPDPKKAMEQAVRAKRRRRLTAHLFAELARRLGFHSCEDPAFNKLRNILQQWFPQ